VQFDKKTAASAQGPVGIVREVQTQLKAGLSEAVLITIILSVLLGLFNLLPIPALDGGRILFRVLEIVTRLRMKPLREALIHTYGFYVMVALLIVVTIKDVRGCIGI
jgi:regulator of sigma E protease